MDAGEPMSRRRLVRIALVLALMFLFGLASAVTSPDGSHIGYMWPVGLASGALIMCDRRTVAYVGAVMPALAFATFALADYPIGVSAGYGITITLEALVARQILTGGKEQRLRL